MNPFASRFARRFVPLLGGLAVCASIDAQTDCEEKAYYQVWVDPFYGNDAQSSVDDPTQPYATLNRAITVVDGMATPQQQGLVHALPGLYASDNPIPQTFPIVMRSDVHVQGAGAKECVLRVRSGAVLQPYWPDANGLTRRASTIAVDFTIQTQIDEPSRFDGFTIQGADVQVYAETELGPRSGVVSNCVFDMRHEGYEDLSGPYFGVLIAAIYFGEDGVDYYDMPFFLFNNTFLQGVRYGVDDADVEVAREESVAICNLNDPAPPCPFPICFTDPNTTIRGVSELHVQNNLIRSLDLFPRTAMLGIDRGDTSVVVSSRAGQYDTNAFDANAWGQFDLTGTFFSDLDVGETQPVPVLDMTAADPGFVGEYHSGISSGALRLRDARLLPDSVLLDLGASPAWIDGACDAPFQAANGLLHVDVTRSEAISSFDFDGDGHGNPRIVGADVEVGFDEIDVVMVAGSYGNDTKSHHLPYDATLGSDSAGIPRIPTGTPDRDYVFASPQSFALALHMIPFTDPRIMWGLPAGPEQIWTTTGFWTHMPGTTAFRVTEWLPGAPIGIPGIELWLDWFGGFTLNFGRGLGLVATNAGTFGTTPASWTNTESGQTHVFHVFGWTVDETVTPVAPTYFPEQAFVIDPVLGILSSNLMAEYL